MLDREEANLPNMDSICDMVEKKRRDRADEVEPHADDELDMGDGRGVVAYAILKNAKFTPL